MYIYDYIHISTTLIYMYVHLASPGESVRLLQLKVEEVESRLTWALVVNLGPPEGQYVL